MSRNHPLLSVQDLKVHFRGQDHTARAVDGVSYDIHAGETVCLVGESGCGKTVSAL
ncbi:MAG: ABC transporter ATP-binding protein, partial [Deltaproteobacteria bacterium]